MRKLVFKPSQQFMGRAAWRRIILKALWKEAIKAQGTDEQRKRGMFDLASILYYSIEIKLY